MGWVVAVLAALAGCGRWSFDPTTQLDASATEDVPDPSCGPGSEVAFIAPAPPPGAFWISPTGSDAATGTSPTEAWATFAHAFTVVGPGDTLVLADGVYSEPLTIAASGAPGAPLVVRALTDGGALLDGGGTTIPCEVDGSLTTRVTDVTIEGIQCKNGPHTVHVHDADRITLRRVSAYDASSDANSLFRIERVNDALLEDLAGTGPAGELVFVLLSNRVTLRRAWMRWVSSSAMYRVDYQIRESSDNVLENCIADAGPGATIYHTGFQFLSPATSTLGTDRNALHGSLALGAGGWNVVYQSPTKRLEGNRVRDLVTVGGNGGLFQRADADLRVAQTTIVAPAEWNCWSTSPQTDPKDADFALGTQLAGSIFTDCAVGIEVTPIADPFVTAFLNEHNNLFNVAQPYLGSALPGTGDVSADPAFEIARFGTGAYLRGPSAEATTSIGAQRGARMLHRIVDGAVTTEPLWPWPMEARIRRETGRSVTWEDGGGVWRTLCGAYD